MKLKYYLRGLGIGIIVTAVIMGVSVEGKTEPMTDAQIMEKAKELGMVDGVLSQLSEQAEVTEPEAEKPAEKPAKEPAAKEPAAEAEAPKEEEPAAKEPAAEAEAPKEEEPAAKEPEAEAEAPKEEEPVVESSYIVTVYPGEGSYTVSRKLAALGLVESADIYDEYLCQNGYDKRICTGNHEIKAGMTAEQIAKALTSR